MVKGTVGMDSGPAKVGTNVNLGTECEHGKTSEDQLVSPSVRSWPVHGLIKIAGKPITDPKQPLISFRQTAADRQFTQHP